MMSYFWAKTTREGKPGISVYRHMLNVGNVARCLAEMSPALLEHFGLDALTVGALSALHDLGKISPGFQRKCDAWLEESGLAKVARNGCWDKAMESDHGKVSHSAIQTFLLSAGVNHNTAKFVSTVLGGHHGRLNMPNDRGYRPQGAIAETASSIDWAAERLRTAKSVVDHFAPGEIDTHLDDSSAILWWLAGITSVADWIGSDERFFSPVRGAEDEQTTAPALKALKNIGFSPLTIIKGLSFESLFGFKPNEMQVKAMSTITAPGVYVIEAPMGMGKTEAALGVAYQLMASGKASGIYFALPTQATSNRIHLRMNDFLKRIAPEMTGSRLIHGNSWLMANDMIIAPAVTETQGNARDDARVGRDWFSSPKRALLAPFGVGTVDQALLGVVAAKHFFVRQYALAGKVVILDELHSYDLYTGALIDKLAITLEELGCTVIVLSATLTDRRRHQIIPDSNHYSEDEKTPYPLIAGRRESVNLTLVAPIPPDSRPVNVAFIHTAEATEEAIHVARKGGAVLWICDTVGAAQKQRHLLASLIKDEFPVGLIHSRFPFWQRENLEDEWMERFGKEGTTRCGSILVSTQIVEQSVDLDADLLITELAPTDMLLQRLGRLWRHNRTQRPLDSPHMYIIEEKKSLEELGGLDAKAITDVLGNKSKVYAPYVLLRSLRIWKTLHKVTLPSQIRQLIESTYIALDDEPSSWQELSAEWFGTDSAKEMVAYRNSNLWGLALEDREGVQTRINEMPTVSLVLCRSFRNNEAVFADGSHGKFEKEKFDFPTAQRIHRNLVKVPEYCFERVKRQPSLDEYLYETCCVGILKEGGSLEVKGLKQDTKFVYSHILGLVIERLS
ncbi:MAG: CRISPR-associated helicase Cas3' [Syntrophorhabdus aromaticivorans]|uniref:CRISPR-associated helicase Cas3 n=1 Tax=Syntrophorhabdus aromaticivorans TaxID=328301 RepID=A0A971S1P3_9BACT|nr:CRISPR-associated helicase Cas3' [Syntrophorhabdus aromaticivorans]